MPPEFQKIKDNILHATKNMFIFLDDILKVTKGKRETHMQKVEEVLNVLDQAGIQITKNANWHKKKTNGWDKNYQQPESNQ